MSEAEKIIADNDIDWEKLYLFADIHGIKPQLAKLAGQSRQGAFPADFCARLNEDVSWNLVNQLNYFREFLAVRDLLAGEGIDIIPFKGFSLASEAHGDFGGRESFDVDVFIRTGDLDKLKILMEAGGYVEEESYSGLSIRQILKWSQEYCFDRIEGGSSRFHIEFHWGICPPAYGMGIRLEDLGSQITGTNLSSHIIKVFTPSAHLLLVLFHHGGKDRFVQLKQVHDIALLISRHPGIDWSWLAGEAARFHAEKLIYVGTALASALTGIKIPEAIRSRSEDREIIGLAKERALAMERPAEYGFRFNLDNWLFRMRTRSGLGTRIGITAATGRETLRKFMPAASK